MTTLGYLFLFGLSGILIAHWDAVRAKYWLFTDWCTNSGTLGLIVYAGVCGVVVWIISWWVV